MLRFARTVWLIPRNILVAFVITWRKLISPLYGNVCLYYPSCSAYGLGSIQQHGFVLGSLLTSWRILRCNPFAKGGVDEVKPGPSWLGLTKLGFVYAKDEEVASEKEK